MIVSAWAVTCVAVMVSLMFVYVYWVRPRLQELPALRDAYKRQATCWMALKVWLDGRKTILIGIWGQIIAFGPDALQQISGFDLKMLLGLPDLWAAWVAAVIPILMLIMRAQSSDK